jgi:hypothetical protein
MFSQPAVTFNSNEKIRGVICTRDITVIDVVHSINNEAEPQVSLNGIGRSRESD